MSICFRNKSFGSKNYLHSSSGVQEVVLGTLVLILATFLFTCSRSLISSYCPRTNQSLYGRTLTNQNLFCIISPVICLPCYCLNAEVGRLLFWSAGRWSPVYWATEMIADQQTGKNCGPALADYRNRAFANLLFCFFGLILKKFQREEIIK